MCRVATGCGRLNIVKATRLLSHQNGLSSPDSSLRLLTRKEVQRILTERQFATRFRTSLPDHIVGPESVRRRADPRVSAYRWFLDGTD
jgi:hypothetical protein